MISAKNFENPIQKYKFYPNQSILVILNNFGLDIYRTLPEFEKVFTITPQLLNNKQVIDFTIDQYSKQIVVSTNKPKIHVFEISENNDFKPFTAFNPVSTNINKMRIFKTKLNVEACFNNFRAIYDGDYKNEVSAKKSPLDIIFKSSFTHLFTMAENFNKIQKLEHMIIQNSPIYVLTVLDDKRLRFAFNSITEFLNIDTSGFIDKEDYRIVDFDQNETLNKLRLIYKGKEETGIIQLDMKKLSQNITECFYLNYSLMIIKEMTLNLKLGFFNTKNKFKEVKKQLLIFLENIELEEDEENIVTLRQFIKFGVLNNPKFLDFFENIDMKKLNELYKSINQLFDVVIDFFTESLLPGFDRIRLVVSNLKGMMESLDSNTLGNFDVKKLEDFSKNFFALSKSIQKLFTMINDKKLHVLNFLLFLFKMKIKTINSLSYLENPETRAFYESLLDYEFLLNYLSSEESIFLDDLIGSFDQTALYQEQTENNNIPLSDELSKKFKELEMKIHISEKASVQTNSDGMKEEQSIKTLFQKIDTNVNSLMKELKMMFGNNISKDYQVSFGENINYIDLGRYNNNTKLFIIERTDSFFFFKMTEKQTTFTKIVVKELNSRKITGFRYNNITNRLILMLMSVNEGKTEVKEIFLNDLNFEIFEAKESKQLINTLNTLKPNETRLLKSSLYIDPQLKGHIDIQSNETGIWGFASDSRIAVYK